MGFTEIIQNIVTGSAVFLGLVYIIGGLIVNLNLTRRGVVEYQILKVKFLAVGIIFIIQFLGVEIFTAVPVVLIASLPVDPALNALFVQALSIPSILASLALLYVWSRFPPNTKSRVGKWQFWFVVSTIATIFPLYVLLHQLLLRRTSFDWIFNSILAVPTGILAVMAMIYHYSSFYYGRPVSLGALDPIGMGIPTRVNILCDGSHAPDLAKLGLPIRNNIIHDIYLVDETGDYYIISPEQIPGGEGDNQTYKLNKNLVKAILHKPDHMRKLAGELMGGRKK